MYCRLFATASSTGFDLSFKARIFQIPDSIIEGPHPVFDFGLVTPPGPS